MEGDGMIGVSGTEVSAMAQTVGTEGTKGVSEIISNGDAMTETIVSVDGIKMVRETKNSVKGVIVSGIIQKENGMKNKKVGNSDDIDVVVNEIGLEKEGAVKLTTSERVAGEKTLIAVSSIEETQVEAINNNTNIQHVDSEQAGIERLAKIERLAENERQEKIKRREELDRVARLQRILALVRAPELDSVTKMKQVDLKQEKDIKRDEDINVLKVLGVNTDKNPSIVNLRVDDKQLTKETVVDGALRKKKQIEFEGIAKLERMSKEERILQIDRLVNLELEAEAKRKADIEHAAKLERDVESERETKMKYLREFDLIAELEKTEKKRLAEIERQEKIERKEELDRIAELQQVFVMVKASESDRAAEMKRAELEQTAEMKRKEEIKLLEELGILPRHEGTEKGSARKLEPMKKANLPSEVDINLVKGVKPMVDVKEKVVNPVKDTIAITEIKQIDPLVEVETVANAEQPIQKESVSIKEMIADTQKEAIKNPAVESQTNMNNEARKKRREELERVAKLQRIIATVRNAEPNGVAQVKLDVEVDKTADLKHTEEMKLLEELGIVPKKHATQKESRTDGPVEKLKVQSNDFDSVKQMHPVTKVKADVKISIESNAEQLTEKLTKVNMEREVESEKEVKIKRAAEMERKAKADREARIKRREELDRMANLQRVVAFVSNEDFDHVANMKDAELNQIKEKKRKEDLKVPEALGIVPRKEATQTESNTNLKTPDKKETLTKMENIADLKFKMEKGGIDVEPANAEKMAERIKAIKTMTEKETKSVRQDVGRRIEELRVAQMKRVAELGREMKQVAMIDENLKSKQEKPEQTINNEHKNKVVTHESKQMIETKYKNMDASDVKHLEEKQLDFSLAEVEGAYVSGIKLNKHSKSFVDLNSEKGKVIESEMKDYETPEVKREGFKSVGLKSEKELKSTAVPPLIEVKREPVIKLVELKRLSEMKAVGMERVRRRDCEWDGQMMYVGRERM